METDEPQQIGRSQIMEGFVILIKWIGFSPAFSGEFWQNKGVT
jgi:hypothetical protein